MNSVARASRNEVLIQFISFNRCLRAVSGSSGLIIAVDSGMAILSGRGQNPYEEDL
jgi:hypothetical protein